MIMVSGKLWWRRYDLWSGCDSRRDCRCLDVNVLYCYSVAGIIMKATDVDTPLAIKLLTAGTAACVADFASFPLDTAKVRLQVSLYMWT
jgi:hypothetical protein